MIETFRDHLRRETHVVVPDKVFEVEGVICRPGFERGAIPAKVCGAIMDAAYQASPRAFIDHMREKKRRNYLRRFPWLRMKG